MHDGCSGRFDSGMEVLQKVRIMGFSMQYLPMPLALDCKECGQAFTMETFESKCPHCGMIHAVTPCHAFDAENIMAAGKNA